MRRFCRFLALSIFFCLLNYPLAQLHAQNEVGSAMPLSFAIDFPMIHEGVGLGSAGISIGITVDSGIAYRGDMILLTESSVQYAEAERTATLYIETSNFASLLELDFRATISISYGLSTWEYDVQKINFKYAVPDMMGSLQRITLGDYLLFSFVVPTLVMDIPVSIYARPLVRYIPTLRGNLMVEGPASTSPSTLYWTQETSTAQLYFSDTRPVNVFLGNPQLTLDDLSVSLQIYALVEGVRITSPDITLVGLGDYVSTTSTMNLISFEPNYYRLYTELQTSYTTLASTVQEVQNTINGLTIELGNLQGEMVTLTGQVQDLAYLIEELDINTLRNRVSALSQNFTFLTSQVRSLSNSMDQLSLEVNTLAQRTQDLESQMDRATGQAYMSTFAIALSSASFIASVIVGFLSLKRAKK